MGVFAGCAAIHPLLFEHPVEATALALPGQVRIRQAISLRHCEKFQVRDNKLLDPGHHTIPNNRTGNGILGCDDRCSGIVFDGIPASPQPLIKPDPP